MLVMTLVYEPDREQEYLKKSKTAMQAADNVFQWNVIDGLIANIGATSINLCNSIPVGSYPKANKKIVYKGEKHTIKGVHMRNIGFLNLPVIKPLCRFFSYIRTLTKRVKNDGRVLIYGLYMPQLLALTIAKKWLHRPLETVLIIDDLPAQYGIVSGNAVKRALKTFVGKIELKFLNDRKVIDHFTFLTENMKEAVRLEGRDYTVVEGMAKTEHTEPLVPEASSEKIVFYAGTLNRKFGIGELLEAFSLLKGDDYALWICGDGDAREQVEKMQKTDVRVRYYGFVNKKRADELMASATVLVNPRRNESEYTRYSFPSKTIEYLLAAKPVVMYKLDGIPDEYDKYLCYITGNTPQNMADRIEEVCQNRYGETADLAHEGMMWVRQTKNPVSQMEKVLALYAD